MYITFFAFFVCFNKFEKKIQEALKFDIFRYSLQIRNMYPCLEIFNPFMRYKF